MDALTTVSGAFIISNNARLPTCEAENLLAQVDGMSGEVEIYNNDDGGTCP